LVFGDLTIFDTYGTIASSPVPFGKAYGCAIYPTVQQKAELTRWLHLNWMFDQVCDAFELILPISTLANIADKTSPHTNATS